MTTSPSPNGNSTALAVDATGLGKRYLLGDGGAQSDSFRQTVAALLKAPFARAKHLAGNADGNDVLWALRDVDLKISKGEVLGIIGKNGSGKSTLLKLLARVTAPTEGTARLRGRVGSLLEVGTGFHADLTARENIFLNGALLGMSRAEMRAQLDAIVAFSEVGRFLDTPVKRFSTGMYIRLGFAVAAHIRSDILLVDEVLAVGDAAFQRKCLDKMSALSASGRTVIFVSHNMATVRKLCPRVIWLDQGRCVQDGAAHDVVTAYLTQDASKGDGPVTMSPTPAAAVASIHSAGIRTALSTTIEGDTTATIEDVVDVCVDVDVRHQDTGLSLVMRLYAPDGTCVLSAEDTDGGTTPLGDASAGRHRLSFRLPAGVLAPNLYRADFSLLSMSNGEVHQPSETIGIELIDVGSWRTTRAPYRGGGIIAPTLDVTAEALDGE